MATRRAGAMPVLVPLMSGALVWPLLSDAQTSVAGFTPGTFRVNENGAAEYRVSIQVPPGIAGMQPQLALAYQSQAGNGLLGYGWALQGLSVIARCPRTMHQDGVRGTVKYDANDRYCLDGQRLMLVSGTNFAAAQKNIVLTAIAGGAASVVAGDKFANGALTASFGYLFNECFSRPCSSRGWFGTRMVGGTPVDRESAWHDIDQIDSTERGRELLEQQIATGNRLEINLAHCPMGDGACVPHKGTWPFTSALGQPVYHPPGWSAPVKTTAGIQLAPSWVILGHEIGHSVTDLRDPQNIHRNENPMRRQSGLPERIP